MSASTASNGFRNRLALSAAAVTRFLDDRLSASPKPGEAGRPAQLVEAMRYGVLNGGKRFRPFLVIECANLASGLDMDDHEGVLAVAAALEAIHCYSLIHDDLPSMDDDDLRRGAPTVHIAYDEASAILAGDALLTEAFWMVSEASHIDSEMRCQITAIMARDAGTGGMVGGQVFDLANEHAVVDEQMIVMTQALKTGALIRAACEVGALAGGGNSDDCERLRRYGEVIGLTFQIADDLLDLTSDAATLGKTAGKDQKAGKQTLVSFHGEDWARQKLISLVDEAKTVLSPYGERAHILESAAEFVAERRS